VVVSTSRTVFVALLLAACAGDDTEPAATPTTAAPDVPATLPAEVEPGRGALVLDGELGVLEVSACSFVPVTDPATGVTTVVTATAHDSTGRTVDVVRSSFEGDVPTVTDTVTVADPEGTVEASRAQTGGRQIDLRVENPVGALLDIDEATGTVRAAGVFGPVGGRPGDPANVDGELLLRCPAS
jgi:hypothetical protein